MINEAQLSAGRMARTGRSTTADSCRGGRDARFFRLGSRELSIDESLSWAESSGHNVKAVLRVQHQLDSGKFPIYEIAQHGWMRVFGESEAAMRALPALIGSLSIVLVFILGVECDAWRLNHSRRCGRRAHERPHLHGGGAVRADLCGWASVGRNRAPGANVFDDAGVDSRAGDFSAPRAAARRAGELRWSHNFFGDRCRHQLHRGAGDCGRSAVVDLPAACPCAK